MRICIRLARCSVLLLRPKATLQHYERIRGLLLRNPQGTGRTGNWHFIPSKPGGRCVNFLTASAKLILISQLINRNMVNKTRKVKELSNDTLQKLTGKYCVTKSGSKKQVALRLWELRRHIMTTGHLKSIEDFLKVAPAKRYKGTRRTSLKCET